MMTLLLAAVAAFSFGEVRLDCKDPGPWRLDLRREVADDGAEIAKIALSAPAVTNPPAFRVAFRVPQVDIGYVWSVNGGNFSVGANWASREYSELSAHMPLHVYFNGNDTARLSVAASEARHRVNFSGGVREEGSLIDFSLGYFAGAEAPIDRYETEIRIDTVARPFADAVRGGVRWIERTAACEPCVAPAAAFDPLYSTWYDFHQDVFDGDIGAELEIAAKLGMKTVILDDGWQTDDNARGYAYCGDWQVSKRRFPDMRAHVAKAHALGMKYMVWYSVPFVGLKSANYAKFKGKYLIENVGGMNAGVLDPRFPEVRAFLVDTYVRAMKDWDLDGFKLDFIDSFRFEGVDPAERDGYAGRDIKSVPLAVDRLLADVRSALVAIKPGVLIEFRQGYVGPAIRKYGNMLRVGDCPGDMRRNRFAIANLRLASGQTAVHSDMLEWNFGDTPERAALFVLNSLFGVIQYSVMLRDAPESHRAMIAHWLRFSQDHRATLMGGRFTPHHAELQYPLVEAEGADERVIAVYDDGRLVDVGSLAKRVYLVNATGAARLAVKLGEPGEAEVFDTFGKSRGRVRIAAGLSEVACPESGYLAISR